MNYAQKCILFLWLTSYAVCSYAIDSSSVMPMQNPTPMHRTSHIDVHNAITHGVNYDPNGDQILKPCRPDHALVNIKNASDKIYWGPPEAIIILGDCSGFGCWCAGSPHSCCAWCDPPVVRIDKVRWQSRPTNNQFGATNENMPSVLSEAGCAPITTTWEPAA